MPITIVECEICKKEFRIEMERSRRGGYFEPSTDLTLTYENTDMDDCAFDEVCPACASAIANVVRVKVHEIRREKGA